eukprot:CAMPEP_0183297716 /NCGR_PEP_ID=MMETSP0160_2-20130417/4932_1 /TAXON_ID=2839 ORGANISM="Odontella Sinensis, Strain Grunow 1884" /NCGR_SAMPLE_ID=MMETSP0160_2 /ASSEMBLY_ACC=CAM_ASM_000250 /LENGTH=113 /DNA_ID=CAMNT_0025459591 /DNA_START=1 /DNA_END=339 /DNA_ORIENTATION=-
MGGPNATSSLTGRSLEAAAARESENEHQYRDLFSNLLQKISQLKVDTHGNHDYDAENAVLSNVNETLTQAVAGGVAVGLAAFISLRYLPAYLVRSAGKKSAARESTAQAGFAF